MSLDDPTPTEYFGPHAKRWTNPDTGVTMSLSPREYYRAVAKEQLRREEKYERRRQEAEPAARNDEALREEELRQLAQLKSRTVSEKATEAITAREEKLRDEAVSAAWNDEALDEGVVTIDRLGDPRAAPMADLFKEEGVLIAPLSSWNPPEHQRYDLNGFRELAEEEERGQPLQASEGLPTFATRGGIKYPTVPPATFNAGGSEISADGIKPAGTVRFLSLVEDDTFGLIRPVEQTAPGKPAARHFRRRKIGRIAAALGLVYIIAVIGVLAVAGVLS